MAKAPKEKSLVSEEAQDMEEEILALPPQSIETEQYHDQESEWEDEDSNVEEKSPLAEFNRDFTGKGLSGKTDLTDLQAVLLYQFRLLEEDYSKRFPSLKLAKASEWFEIYRLSIGRKSRTETVDMTKGRLQIEPTPDVPPDLRRRF